MSSSERISRSTTDCSAFVIRWFLSTIISDTSLVVLCNQNIILLSRLLKSLHLTPLKICRSSFSSAALELVKIPFRNSRNNSHAQQRFRRRLQTANDVRYAVTSAFQKLLKSFESFYFENLYSTSFTLRATKNETKKLQTENINYLVNN